MTVPVPANVERLVMPAVIEPLHKEWGEAQAAAMTLAAEGKPNDAVKELRRFQHRLCNVRVLDSACGSDNFLYFTLEHLKRLSSRVGRVRAERNALFESFSFLMSALSLQMPALSQLDPLSIVQEFSALELIPEWM